MFQHTHAHGCTRMRRWTEIYTSIGIHTWTQQIYFAPAAVHTTCQRWTKIIPPSPPLLLLLSLRKRLTPSQNLLPVVSDSLDSSTQQHPRIMITIIKVWLFDRWRLRAFSRCQLTLSSLSFESKYLRIVTGLWRLREERTCQRRAVDDLGFRRIDVIERTTEDLISTRNHSEW